MAKYVIIERDKDGIVHYLPPLAAPPPVGMKGAPPLVSHMPSDVTEAWKFADKAAADEYADDLKAQNPGRHLEVIELPETG